MLVATWFDVPVPESDDFLVRAQEALSAFAACAGFVRGRIGRAADDPTAWVLTTEWDGVGAYRRSLSSYDVKVSTAPLLSRGRDEPSAFEVLWATDATDAAATGAAPAGPSSTDQPSRRARDADEVGVGHASAPAVPGL